MRFIYTIVRFLFVVLILGVSSLNYAQTEQANEEIPIARISYNSNFQDYLSYPNTCLNDVHTDSNNMLWFGDCSTSKANTSGLYSFDGYKFKFVKFSNSFANTDYNQFTEIIDDKIFGFTLASEGNKLFYYDLREKKVVYYDTLNKKKGISMFGDRAGGMMTQGIINDTIYNYTIRDSQIKVKTYTKETKVVFHDSTKVFKQFINKNKDNYSKLLFFYKNWVVVHLQDTNELFFKNIQTGKEKHIELSNYIDTSKYYKLVCSGFENNIDKYNFILQTENTSHYFGFLDIKSDIFLKLFSKRNSKPNYRTKFFKDTKGNIIYLNLVEDKVVAHISIKNDKVYDISSVFKDANTSGFITLRIRGNNFLEAMLVLESGKPSIFKIDVEPRIQMIKISKEVRSLVSVSQNKLIYMSPNSFGLTFNFQPVVFNLENNTETTLEGFCDFKHMDLSRNKSHIWGINEKNELVSYNLKSKACKTFDFSFYVTSFFVLNEEELILIDKSSQFWLFNSQTEEAEQMLASGKQLQLESEFFYMQKDSENRLWIASSIGLHLYYFKTKSISDIKDKIDDFDFSFNAILKVDDNQLLLGSHQDGLILLNTLENSFTKISTNEGLPYNTIASITKDNNGYYWIGTYDGVAVLDPDFNHLGNLFEEDGLVHNENNRKSAVLLEDGRVAIGSIAGVSIIDTEKAIRKFKEKKDLKIYLTSLEKYDFETKKSTSIAHKANNNKDIVLEPSSNKLDIEFSTSNYIKHLQTSYYYKIQGLQDDWVELGTVPKLTLFGLASGKYTLLIKAIDYQGNTTQNIVQLGIIVNDFYYNKLWFYLLIILVLGIISYIWIKSQNIRIKRATQKINQDKLTIENQANKLKVLDEAKTNFFTNITHEFRTPLTVINSIVDLLKQKDKSVDKKELLQIEQNSSQLLGMVNQILDLRKLDSSKMKLHFIQSDILLYIAYIVDAHQYLAQQKGISLQLSSAHSEIMMDFDAEKLKTILSNILSNALKYTNNKGKIEIKVDTVEDKTLRISIQDTGMGISNDDIEDVFDYFNESDSVFQSKNSSGIGLNLTKKLVELWEGEINLSSQMDKGTRVDIKLPITRKAKTALPDLETDIHTDNKDLSLEEDAIRKKDTHSVLIIEDNEAIRQILALQLQGYTIEIAKDGEEGIEKAIECIPDIIISDVMMPKKSGNEVCETLKLDWRTSHIPIVLLTAKADQESKLEGLRAKADAYLYKPYDVEELKIIITNLLESRAKMQALYKNLNKKSPSTDRPQEDRFILEFRDVLIRNIKEDDFDIEDLCKHLKISRSQLHKKLKVLTGLSTSNYILLIRLQKASELLESTLLNMSEVAYEVGLNDASYFSKKFKEEFGMPPSEWRERAIDM